MCADRPPIVAGRKSATFKREVEKYAKVIKKAGVPQQ